MEMSSYKRVTQSTMKTAEQFRHVTNGKHQKGKKVRLMVRGGDTEEL